jgi:hypothetical protein
MRLTQKEKNFIIENHKVFNSYTLLMRHFKSQFKKKHAPSHKNVKNIIEKFAKTGSVQNLLTTGRPRTARTEAKIKRVEAALKNKRGMSVSRVALSLDISYSSVYRMASYDLNLYPYKMHFLHELQPGDPERRINFANWFLSIPEIEKIFIASDEAYFYLDGAVNNHNCRIWSDSDPYIIIQQPLYPLKLLVWCAVSATRVYGPFFSLMKR